MIRRPSKGNTRNTDQEQSMAIDTGAPIAGDSCEAGVCLSRLFMPLVAAVSSGTEWEPRKSSNQMAKAPVGYALLARESRVMPGF